MGVVDNSTDSYSGVVLVNKDGMDYMGKIKQEEVNRACDLSDQQYHEWRDRL